MAKITQNSGTKKNAGAKKTFEERLERLEELGDEIRKNDIPLDDAIKAFEEGLKLARTLEKDLEKIETRIEILMNGTGADSSEESDSEEKPELGLFDEG
ncbi:MAG: exodeoxyribonuclease VII small subunit [Treponema sp.]|nr:exodeoxyribonuclease VII small subunit [Treponema sp.]